MLFDILQYIMKAYFSDSISKRSHTLQVTSHLYEFK
jgi:hypothetical protein